MLDEATGLRYDQATGLFYNETHGLFFDTTGRYFEWDAKTNGGRFVDVPTPEAVTAAKEEASKAAKKAAKKARLSKHVEDNLERWQRQQAKLAERGDGPVIQPLGVKKVAGKTVGTVETFQSSRDSNGAASEAGESNDAGLAEGDEAEPTELLRTLPPLPDAVNAFDALQRRGFVNLEKNACLLCKRQLPSREKLELHASASTLHATNVKATRETVLAALSEEQRAALLQEETRSGYRDRALERRKKYNQPDRPKGAMAKPKFKPTAPPSVVEQPTKHGIKADNKGNKMLRAMGWTEGTGLGRSKQGIVAPVEAEVRVRGAGLGAAPVLSTASAGEANTWKEAAYLSARARFSALQKDEQQQQQ